jgi:DNA-binding CsgD family transcriptional regulator
LQAAAVLQGIQVTTARAYLGQIFRKTGTNQQSQLASLLRDAQPPGSV